MLSALQGGADVQLQLFTATSLDTNVVTFTVQKLYKRRLNPRHPMNSRPRETQNRDETLWVKDTTFTIWRIEPLLSASLTNTLSPHSKIHHDFKTQHKRYKCGRFGLWHLKLISKLNTFTIFFIWKTLSWLSIELRNLQHEDLQQKQLRSSDNSDVQRELIYDSMPRNCLDNTDRNYSSNCGKWRPLELSTAHDVCKYIIWGGKCCIQHVKLSLSIRYTYTCLSFPQLRPG